MTDTECDGWPEEYRDPRERPHPEMLRVTVESFEGVRKDTVAAAKEAEAGNPTTAVVSFSTVVQLRKILTDRRLELLRTLMNTDGAAESITALADTVGRDYRTVHDDTTLLERYGLLYLVEEGRAKRPYVPYGRIHLHVELVARNGAEEPASA
jgi:predicted transcriptional regulator